MSTETARPRAVVKNITNETPTLLSVALEVSDEVKTAFVTPGQYIVLHPEGDKPVFMAIASAPGSDLELLVGPGAADKLGLVAGASIEIDPPAGKGYAIDLAKNKDIILFSVGSGLSAIRSVIDFVRAHREDYGRVVLFHGAHTDEDHAYRRLDEVWATANIEVRRSNSKPWVQDVFRANPVPVESAVAFVCGMKEMVAGVTEALVEAGLDAGQVRQNF